VADTRVSVDWDGVGAFGQAENFGVCIASIENPTGREDLLFWTWRPWSDALQAVAWDGAGSYDGLWLPDVTTNPDTLFIDRTATGWSFGSITGGVETVHFANVTEMGGVTITADGSALGLWSDMRSSTSPRTLSNLTIDPISCVRKQFRPFFFFRSTASKSFRIVG